MQTRYRILGIALVLLAAGAGVFFQRLPPALQVTHPAKGPAVEAVYATGTVEATVMLPISARTTARLVELNADEGSMVTKGQILARLEDSNLRKSLEQVQARERLAQKNYERRAALAKRGYETKSALDQALADRDAATAAVAEAKAEIDFMQMSAPADGRIIRRDGEIGQMIAANQPVFWISCCAPLRIGAEVDEENIATVKPGQAVLIRADAFPGQVFHGAVQGITPKGDPVARSYRVRINLNDKTPLQIGMTTETNIIINERQNALLLPTGTVTDDGRVWLVKDGQLQTREVKTGIRGPEQTEIRDGLTTEDLVVLKPVATLQAGRKVRVTLAAPTP